MATSTQYLPIQIELLADFKTWGQAIGIALTAFGWTQDGTVNGQVVWSTVTQTPYQSNQSLPLATTVNFRGAYSNAGVSYALNDIVTFNGMTWINISAYTSSATTVTPGNDVGNPSGSTQHWMLYCFEVWKSATTPTMYLKFEYSGNPANLNCPLYRIAVGTSDDTSGNLGTGAGNQVTNQITLPLSNTASTASAEGVEFPCFFSGDNGGRFAMMIWPDLTNFASFWGVERSLSSSGSYYTTPSGAVTPYWTVVSLVYSGSVAVNYLINTTGSTWIKPASDGKITTLLLHGQHTQQFESVNENTMFGTGNLSTPALPIFPLVGWVGNPLTIAMSSKLQDTPQSGSFTVQMYGSTRTYLNSRNGNFSSFGEGTNNNCAMRFD